jgi:hypothetical protein
MKPRSWITAALLAAAPLRAQDDLPKHAPGDSLDFEPKLMLDGPGVMVPDSTPTPTPGDRIEELKAELIRAEQRAADAEQLYKEGILAKVEAEGRVLHVTEVTWRLANACVEAATAQADAVKKSFDAHQAAQADVDAANAALKAAQDAAKRATADWNKAELDAAALDLQRKRKLYAEGVGSRRELEMAEERYAQLSGTGATR